MAHRSAPRRFPVTVMPTIAVAALMAAATVMAAVMASVTSAAPSVLAKPTPARDSIRLLDHAFVLPSTIPGPLVDIDIVNTGKVAHEIAIAKLRPGTTIEQVITSIKRHEHNPKFVVDDPGGITMLGPGQRLRYQRVLEPGLYEIFCPMPMSDGSSHAERGMVALLTVTNARNGTLPRADSAITLTDKAVALGKLKAGTHSIAITNRGTRPHELNIAGVAKMSDLERGEELGRWIEGGQSGPPPINVDFPGGHQSIKPGVTVIMTITLRSGYTYHFDDTGDGSAPLSADLTLR